MVSALHGRVCACMAFSEDAEDIDDTFKIPMLLLLKTHHFTQSCKENVQRHGQFHGCLLFFFALNPEALTNFVRFSFLV
jgi:hypothetical protein